MLLKDRDQFVDSLVIELSESNVTETQAELIVATICRPLAQKQISNSLLEIFKETCGGNVSYSQEGEDIILDRLFGDKIDGFFIDIGAHHARRFSNTYALYRKGWRGINIDATPGSMRSFEMLRPRDINLELAISDRKEPLSFIMFKEGALNTFDGTLAQSYIDSGWETQGTAEIVPETLADVLDKHLPANQKIDLISIDVEGEELQVLRSNNWSKYCPDIIIIEALETPLLRSAENTAVAFLIERGFQPTAKLFNSIILTRSEDKCAA